MDVGEFWPWLALVALGAYHGVNPAMGWLFAVALGLQEQSRACVLRAFAPIALGHAASVAVVVTIVVIGRTIVSLDVLRWVGAGALVSYGLYRLLWRSSHPRWVGMRVGFRDLTSWSFLMASAHGAGLMLVPVLFNLPGSGPAAETISARDVPHAEYMFLGASPSISTAVAQLTAVGVHTVAMFGVMAAVAIVVYEKLGLRLLRKSWFNLDRVWAAALVLAGVITLLV